MSHDLNQCNFIGRLGADPEVRYTQNGKTVANFRIACGWKGKEREGAEWIPVVTWGKLAEIVGQYLSKGSQVFISGRFATRKWQDKDGNDRYTTEIVADRLQMLGSRDGSGSARQQAPAAPPMPQSDGGFEDDIPFSNPYKGAKAFVV